MDLNWAEINIKFKNSYLKSVIYLENIKLFTIFQFRLRYFVIKIILVLIFVDIRFDMFWVQLGRQKLNVLENENPLMYWVVENLNYCNEMKFCYQTF